MKKYLLLLAVPALMVSRLVFGMLALGEYFSID